MNKFFVKKLNNNLAIIMNDSTQSIDVFIENNNGYDKLELDYKTGYYLIDSKKYGETIKGKVSSYNIDCKLIEHAFEMKNK